MKVKLQNGELKEEISRLESTISELESQIVNASIFDLKLEGADEMIEEAKERYELPQITLDLLSRYTLLM